MQRKIDQTKPKSISDVTTVGVAKEYIASTRHYTIVNRLVFSKNESLPEQFNSSDTKSLRKPLMQIIRALIRRNMKGLLQKEIAKFLDTAQSCILKKASNVLSLSIRWRRE